MNAQPDLFHLQPSGDYLRDAGLERASVNNENWVRVMRERAIKISDVYGSVCADDLRTYAASTGFYPASPNAWGAIFKGKHWKFVDWTKSKIPSNHARAIRVWEYQP